ncbi:MAG: UDP-N-acetylmuramoyl-L-alanyl-D-glutamate--2,6-diaminopimelate ligase [Clostridia bacterium]|nr:UDP-N-acetylmuramoyl-L-alanyl-D-glutamate--2,6-diaminopimelate ligase [Clostridia bacterium]
MRLFRLMEGTEIIRSKVCLDLEINNICSDSRKAEKNTVFVAIKGINRNGNNYIFDALNAGCSCIITDDENIYYEHEKTILTYDSRRTLAVMWDNFYNNPTKNIKVIGITGTNGKTSTSYYLYEILKSAGKSVGLISSIKCIVNGEKIDYGGGGETVDITSAMTTPDPEILYKVFDNMRKSGVEYVVMEASSHALELSKLYPIEFELGIFTNLSREHLDFHKNMDNYFFSKIKLFCKCRLALINGDDKYGEKIPKFINREFVTYGTSRRCDFRAENINLDTGGTSYTLMGENTSLNIKTMMCGEFSLYNSMAASSGAYLLGVDSESIQKGCKELLKIEGRMECVAEGIFIDYAHSPVAFEKVIASARRLFSDKKLIVIFGCGGNRDKSKRALMGKLTTKMADATIITSDNPRDEDKLDIIMDIEKGIDRNSIFYIVPDRKDAIELGIRMRGDNILLILGKGHENYEIDQNGKHFFSEKEIIKEALLKYESDK